MASTENTEIIKRPIVYFYMRSGHLFIENSVSLYSNLVSFESKRRKRYNEFLRKNNSVTTKVYHPKAAEK